MREKISKAIVLIILIAIIYLGGSYISSELNPFKWHEMGRMIVVILVFFLTIAIVPVSD